MAVNSTEAPIIFDTVGALGLITLNRPKALNSLTHAMCLGMRAQLLSWRDTDAVKHVAVRGAGDRAFCAGGDIRAMAESSARKTPDAALFLADEYQLNELIGTYPKPYIALTNGIVMGGGAGICIHGRYRLADEDLAFAMPETGIGFIPDIGSSYFLSRCPDETGMYLALTGTRIGLGDAMALGLMTHSVAASDHPALVSRLAEGAAIPHMLAQFARPPVSGALENHRARIKLIFSAPSVEIILDRLDREGDGFAQETARIIRSRCPFSLKLAFFLVRYGKHLTLRECLQMEYRVGARRVMSADFQEGVRAVLIDKDAKPAWNPETLARVRDDDVAAHFLPLGAQDLASS